jgi:hypothetical protein
MGEYTASEGCTCGALTTEARDTVSCLPCSLWRRKPAGRAPEGALPAVDAEQVRVSIGGGRGGSQGGMGQPQSRYAMGPPVDVEEASKWLICRKSKPSARFRCDGFECTLPVPSTSSLTASDARFVLGSTATARSYSILTLESPLGCQVGGLRYVY